MKLEAILYILGTVFFFAAIIYFGTLIQEYIYSNIENGKLKIKKTLLDILKLLIVPVVALGFNYFVKINTEINFFITSVLLFIGFFAMYYFGYKSTSNLPKLKSKRKKYMNTTSITVALIVGGIIFLLPFIWLVGTSLKEEDQIMQYPPVWIPSRQVKIDYEGNKCPLWTIKGTKTKVVELQDFEDGSKRVVKLNSDESPYITDVSKLEKVRKPGLKWENYSNALNYLPKSTNKGLVYLWNTVYVTLLSILGTLFSCSLVAYAFARLRWPGRELCFALLLATMMLPAAVTMIPVFMIFKELGWVNTLRPLWVPAFFGAPFAVFLMRQFFMSIPKELEEAARIDGASFYTIFFQVMLPLVKPALAALAIMTFMSSWNNFMGALIYINSPEKMTLAYALQLFMGQQQIEYGMLMAASVIVVLPVLIIFFVAQKYFIEGITLTGIKG